MPKKIAARRSNAFGDLLCICLFLAGGYFALWIWQARPDDPFRIIPLAVGILEIFGSVFGIMETVATYSTVITVSEDGIHLKNLITSYAIKWDSIKQITLGYYVRDMHSEEERWEMTIYWWGKICIRSECFTQNDQSMLLATIRQYAHQLALPTRDRYI